MLNNVTSNKRAKLVDTLRTLGRPEKGREKAATQENRHHFRRFITSLGVPSDRASSMRLSTLQHCYNKPRYLFATLHHLGASESDIRFRARLLETCCHEAWGGQDLEQCSHAEAIIAKHRSEKSELAQIEATPEPTEPKPDPEPGLEFSDEPTDTPEPTPEPQPEPEGNEVQAAVNHLLSALGSQQGKGAMDEARIVQLIKEHTAPRPVTVRLVTDEEERKVEGLQHAIFPDVLKAAAAGINVMLVGPAGAGKTTLAEQVATALGRPFHFNGALTSEYKLSGFIDAQGRVISTPFREAYINGGVFLFDEIDGSLPQAVLAFNAALANGHADFPDGNKERHPDFVAIAAANTYGRGADREYVGRFQLDAASLDRFAVMDMDYDEGLERQLSGNAPWCDYVQAIRRAIFDQKIRHVVSPRASINGAKALAAGIERTKVEEMVIWKGLDIDTRNKIKGAL